MKIGYIGGFWATNIGNSFYNLGALYLLKKIFGEKNVFFVPDPPNWMWNVKNNYNFISNIKLDLVFISGPCLNYKIADVYKPIFDAFKKNNIKIAFISAGASQYTKSESEFVKNFLKEYGVSYMLTRDEATYDLYKECDFPVYNGLCTSMFLNDAVDAIPMQESEKYCVMNFSFFHEPIIEKSDENYNIKKRNLLEFQKDFYGVKIVRPNNTMFCRLKHFIFNRENIYYSDLPYGYISILKHAQEVFSDRVHTCAATLIMGGKAMYVKGSKRSHDGRNNLFKRINVDTIYSKPSSLDFEYINEEKNKMIHFLERLS